MADEQHCDTLAVARSMRGLSILMPLPTKAAARWFNAATRFSLRCRATGRVATCTARLIWPSQLLIHVHVIHDSSPYCLPCCWRDARRRFTHRAQIGPGGAARTGSLPRPLQEAIPAGRPGAAGGSRCHAGRALCVQADDRPRLWRRRQQERHAHQPVFRGAVRRSLRAGSGHGGALLHGLLAG